MIPIFVASNTGFSGRTFISLGLAMKLIEQGYQVGYLKPIGKAPVKKGKEVYDADALFIKETLGLQEPLDVISPFVQTYESQTLLFEGGLRDVRKDILEAFKSLKKKDFVIIGGASDLFEGSPNYLQLVGSHRGLLHGAVRIAFRRRERRAPVGLRNHGSGNTGAGGRPEAISSAVDSLPRSKASSALATLPLSRSLRPANHAAQASR